MATSKVTIANLAIVKYGGRKITSLDENTPEAKAINLVFDEVRDEVLAEGIWTFAQKRAMLATLDVTIPFKTDGMSVAYAHPSDMIRLNFISDPSATVKLENIGGVNVILSDTAGLGIQYTYRNEDPSTYFTNFKRALETRLAAAVCFQQTESVKKAELLMKQYQDIDLPKALASDSMQSTPIQANQSEWEFARFQAGAGIIGRPGDQTWHPVVW